MKKSKIRRTKVRVRVMIALENGKTKGGMRTERKTQRSVQKISQGKAQ